MTGVPIQEAAKTNPEVKQLLRDIEDGKVHCIAPYPGMEIPWSQEETDKLDDVLSKIIDNNYK